MRGLLRTPPEGVPTDCLISRIKARRSYLIGEWDRLLAAHEPLAGLPIAPWRQVPASAGKDRGWQALQYEHAWAFARMTEPLREIMAPFFWLGELKQLSSCLRKLSGGQGESEQPLGESLLNSTIRDILKSASSAMSAVQRLSRNLLPYHGGFARLPEEYQKGGCGALETALYDGSLAHIAVTSTHPVMTRYFSAQIDARNLAAIVKQRRWGGGSRPALLAGGTLRTALLEPLIERGDAAGLALPVTRFGTSTLPDDPDQLERILLASQGREMKLLAREPSGVGAILSYLWHCGVEARNLGLLSRMNVAGMYAVERELVR
ncbi:MAG: V-type ATPase subunit [Desulfobacteraceae bacterium]|nr:V-type ATPase subunit [Desulfobacteraceae bacterium]